MFDKFDQVRNVRGVGAIERDEDGKCIISYNIDSPASYSNKSLVLRLEGTLEDVWKQVGNPNSWINKAIWNSLCFSNELNNDLLSILTRCKLALSNLYSVISYVQKSGNESDLNDVCRTITFIHNAIISIEVNG